MTINDEIKSLVDVVLMQGKLVESENVNKCVDLTYSYIANGYKQSRECIQFTIGQLYRIPSASLKAMLPSALESIEKFSKKNKKTNCNPPEK